MYKLLQESLTGSNKVQRKLLMEILSILTKQVTTADKGITLRDAVDRIKETGVVWKSDPLINQPIRLYQY